MPRDFRVYLEDILSAIQKVKSYTSGLSLQDFLQDDKTFDAVVRNLEVIGEAAKHLPEEARKRTPGIDWKKIAGLRDILIHEYFGIDGEIVWDVVQHKLPTLETAVTLMLNEAH
ncbi:MAG: DUF86 domain-containing protein [Nitrospiraceae bacterium]|nr:DUF86 domain-containing protein [Nitrospiraceae bacterium]